MEICVFGKCNTVFHRHDAFRRHVMRVHVDGPAHACARCTRILRSAYSLSAHVCDPSLMKRTSALPAPKAVVFASPHAARDAAKDARVPEPETPPGGGADDDPMQETENEKRQRVRRQNNRKSASKSRAFRKQYVEMLEDKIRHTKTKPRVSAVPPVVPAVRDVRFASTPDSTVSLRCAPCDVQFVDFEAWMTHRRAESTEKPNRYSCNQCNYTSVRRMSVLRHHQTHWRNGKPHAFMECPKCDHQYTHIRSLRTHMQKHHGGTPVVAYGKPPPMLPLAPSALIAPLTPTRVSSPQRDTCEDDDAVSSDSYCYSSSNSES